ncbi:hypothetical protein AB1Y20_016736 [Prymnesium parvum]|uniref:dolichol kinase n=1 Tax=Prymnesium parvum TaxID=97485 RepID=A0AB34I9P0_PRYPA
MASSSANEPSAAAAAGAASRGAPPGRSEWVEAVLVGCLGVVQVVQLQRARLPAEAALVAAVVLRLASPLASPPLSPPSPPPDSPHRPRLSPRAFPRAGASAGWSLAASPLLLAVGALLSHTSLASPLASALAPPLPLTVYVWAFGAALLLAAARRPLAHAPPCFALAAARLGPRAALAAAAIAAAHAALAALALGGARRSFTAGEASTIGGALALVCAESLRLAACGAAELPPLCAARSLGGVATHAVLGAGVLVTAATAAMALPPRADAFSRGLRFYSTAVACVGGLLYPWIRSLLGEDPLVWAAGFIFRPDRLFLCGCWCAAIVLVAAAAAALSPSADQPDGVARKARLLLARKLYHFLALGCFVPAVATQAEFLQLAFAAALSLFALLEVVRLAQVPPLHAPLGRFLARFVDARDSGTLVLTHFYLLLGCALPILLEPALAPIPASGGSLPRRVAPYAGLCVLGMGDAVASIVGVHLGRHTWPGTGKTVEGSVAAVLSVLLLLLAIDMAQAHHASALEWAAVAGCTTLTFILEAFTTQIDNLYLPIFFAATLLTSSTF